MKKQRKGVLFGLVLLGMLLVLAGCSAIQSNGQLLGGSPAASQGIAHTSVSAEVQTGIPTDQRTEAPAEAQTELLTGSLTMDVIDVGQGLSLLFESEGKYLLYDGGDREASSKVVRYLKDRGITELEYVIVSHYDADHLNGIVGALHVFDAKQVIAPNYQAEGRVYASFVSCLEEKGIERTDPVVGNTYPFGSASFTVLAPNQAVYANENDYSVSIRMDCGALSLVVTGDAAAVSELEMLNNGQRLDADLLVIGHHGSDTSTQEAFLEAVSPDIAVISCGRNNSYGHPVKRVMELLESRQILLYRTDLQGDMQFVLNGESIMSSVVSCLDYSAGGTGGNAMPEADETQEPDSDLADQKMSYVLNTNTKRFHDPSCSSVKQIAPGNYGETTENREVLLAQGYKACGNCKP